MRYRFLCLTVLALVLVLPVSAGLPTVHAVSGLTPRGPIYITDNSQFTKANGVTGGNGTRSNPYVISGWEFDPITVPPSPTAQYPTAIDIRYTSAFFVIRNVLVDKVGVGISFLWVVNARIENTTVSNNLEGILLTNSISDVVDNDMAVGNQEGIYVVDSSYDTIANNTIVAASSEGIATQGYQTKNITITQNTVRDGSGAIVVGGATNTTVTRNQIFSNSLGVDVDSSTGTWIVENTFVSDGQWIATHFGGVTHVFHNNFVNLRNTPGVYIDTSSTVSLDNGYPSGGNYWSDYGGVDKCSGPKQDICSGPDGIGDTSYFTDYVNRDNYPLIRPFGAQPRHAPVWSAGSQLSASNIQPTSLVLSWPSAAGAVKYDVLELGLSIGNVSTTSFTVTGLTIGARYAFKVEAGDLWGNFTSDGPSLSVRILPMGAYLGVESGYFGRPYQGGSTLIVNNFTCLGQDQVNVVSLTLSGDLGTFPLSGLPLVLSSGENVVLNMTISIPRSVSVGEHNVTVSVEWQYLAPGNMTWTNAPSAVFSGKIPVYPASSSPGSSSPNSTPTPKSSSGTSTISLDGLGGNLGWLVIPAAVSYLTLVVGAVVLLTRRGLRSPGSAQRVCPSCRTPAGTFALFCGNCGAILPSMRDLLQSG